MLLKYNITTFINRLAKYLLIKMPSHTFVLGVQWHPESMLDCSNMKQLFYALIRYAKVIP